ncbi:MAG: hypothetical protein HC783_07200 [Rhodobacteraceae bacterium]|nr:hypothetical protein [Paracoccaceae bacterium]
MSRHNKIFMFVFCVGMTVLLFDYVKARQHIWHTLPDTFETTHISNLHILATGFGPSANETGFAVVHLSEAGAALIAGGGIPWLNTQPGGRLWPEWSATPVPRDDFWMGRPDSATGAAPDPTVRAVLDRYGHGVNLPTKLETAVDAALNAPGSFYAFGPGGLVTLIVPATRRAYVFYAG